MAKKEKKFDAVKLSRAWRERISRKIGKMTPAEELEFFNRTAMQTTAPKAQVKAA